MVFLSVDCRVTIESGLKVFVNLTEITRAQIDYLLINSHQQSLGYRTARQKCLIIVNSLRI